MTQQEWEKKLKEYLTPLPQAEQEQIVEYYREMYGDRLDAGYSETEILAEFGDPQVCAGRMISENADGAPSYPQERRTGNPYLRSAAPSGERTLSAHRDTERTKTGRSVGEIVGIVSFALLLGLPLGIAALGVVAAFGAVTVGGIVVLIAGVLFSVACPFFAFAGMPAAGIVANVGVGLVCSGVGALLFVGFYLATKYTALACYRAMRAVFARRNKQ